MGYIRDEAIIVTGNPAECEAAQAAANRIGLLTTNTTGHRTNGMCSLLIVPDGSKEGWDDSDTGDAQRDKWKSWAREMYGRDLASGYSFYPRWVHVAYDDNGDAEVVDRWQLDES